MDQWSCTAEKINSLFNMKFSTTDSMNVYSSLFCIVLIRWENESILTLQYSLPTVLADGRHSCPEGIPDQRKYRTQEIRLLRRLRFQQVEIDTRTQQCNEPSRNHDIRILICTGATNDQMLCHGLCRTFMLKFHLQIANGLRLFPWRQFYRRVQAGYILALFVGQTV